MAFKQFQVDAVGIVTVYKRRGGRNIRLCVTQHEGVKVTIPAWATYSAGVAFARDRAAWIFDHTPTRPHPLRQGQMIGKAHRLHFIADRSLNTVQARIKGTLVVVRYPLHQTTVNETVQATAAEACIRALRLQAKKLLEIRLTELAAKYGYEYNGMSVKRLKGKWGSCDHQQHIIFNLFLMQLPWELIDYVIMHELAHTRVMQHGANFWAEMERYTTNPKMLRSKIHKYQPTLNT